MWSEASPRAECSLQKAGGHRSRSVGGSCGRCRCRLPGSPAAIARHGKGDRRLVAPGGWLPPGNVHYKPHSGNQRYQEPWRTSVVRHTVGQPLGFPCGWRGLVRASLIPVDPFERCWCTGVTPEQVRAAVMAGCPATVDDVRRVTGACSGCRSCRPELAAFLAGLARPPGAADDGPGLHEGSL